MNDHPYVERIKALPIFASISGPSADSALKAAGAAVAGGLKLLEIRLTTPGAYRVISDLRREHGDALLVGAGAVVTMDMADRAMKAGAQFLSSPHTDDEILDVCRLKGIFAIPGALTPTEVQRVWSIGSPLVSIYPAGPFGGAAYLRMLCDSFEEARLMPSGGVSAENMREHFRAGAFSVTIGAGLFSAADIQSGSYSRITERAQSLVRAYEELAAGRS